MREFFDPTLEETTILNVSAATKRKAAILILSCEACSDDAEIPFDYVLDWVTGLDPPSPTTCSTNLRSVQSAAAM